MHQSPKCGENMEFFETIKLVKSNWQPYKVWEIEQQKKEKQNEELRKKYPPKPQELEHAKQYGRTIVDAINIMDQHSIDKSEDAALIVQSAIMGASLITSGLVGITTGLFLKKHPKICSKANLPPSIIALLSTTVCMTTFGMISSIWGAQMEKQASRIARFQTRRDDLKDSRHFVVYTQEQLDKAKEIAKTLPEIPETKDSKSKKSWNPITSFNLASKTTKELRRDSISYNDWKKEHQKSENLKNEKFKNINLSSEELSNAEKNRDNITNVIKKIENSSLNYLMNMKMAIITAVILTETACLGGGFGVLKLIEHLQKKKVIPEKSVLAGAIKLFSIKLAPLIGLLALTPSIKLIKDAARIGRFKAKQELLSSPENFISYDSEQRKTATLVQETKENPKGFWAQLKKDFEDIKQLKKDSKEYYQYMKTVRKEELKLDKALEKVEITNIQAKEAAELQKKAFYAFEKMDEKAQRFTDDTDAGVDIAKQLLMSPLHIAASIATFMYYGKIAAKHEQGKLKEFKDTYLVLKFFKTKDFLKVVGIGIIPVIIDIALNFKGIQIKKEAGKIGVMTAMQDLEDPKNFIDEKVN